MGPPSWPKLKKYSILDVNKHNTDEDAWIVVHNKVYDITNYTKHPGSHAILLRNAGSDRSEQFHAVSHPKAAYRIMTKFYIGDLIDNKEDAERQNSLSKVVMVAFTSMAAYILYSQRK